MKWFNPILALTGLTLVSALPVIEKRDAAGTVADLQAIGKSTQDLTAKVKAVPDRNPEIAALGVQSAASSLEKLIKDSTTRAQNSAAFDDAGSQSVAGATFDLQPLITASIDALISKKKPLSGALFGSGKFIVQGTLKNLRTATANFGKAVTTKLTPDYAALAPEVLGEIDAEFARGLAAFK